MDHDTSPAADPPAGGQAAPGRASSRFLYATGHKPLEGYTIKRGIGHGGFGEVYFATSDAGKEVALKLIRRNLDIELRGVRQCLNLKHPNLIALYDIRTDGSDDEWVVMEYVAGESLDQVLEHHPDGMPVEEALAWIRGIASGVAYLHQSGIVHRDLKPANLFLEGPGSAAEGATVKIGDYGLSKFISCSRRSGQTESVGTVHYMAPEISGGRYGREIDTYALGILLYEMLTGHVPFEGESIGEVLMKHLTAEPDLSRLAEPYRTIVARALAKDPEARLQSAEELVALLPGAKPADMAAAAAAVPPPPIREVWQPVSTPPHTAHHGVEPEPLWQAASEGLHSSRDAWRSWNISPVAKGVVLFGIIAALFFNGGWMAGIAFALLPLYVVYYIAWAAFFRPHGTPKSDATVAPSPSPSPKPKQRSKEGWRDMARKQLRARTLRQRLASLTGSMFTASLLAIAASLAVAPLLASSTDVDPVTLSCWLACLTTCGAWAVLIVSAMTEAKYEDQAPARGLQLLLGLGLGFLAFGLLGLLGMGIPCWDAASIAPQDTFVQQMLGLELHTGDWGGDRVVAPSLLATVGYFALVLLILRWWKLAEWTRTSRIGFWSLVGVMFGAWLVTLFWWFPQPVGIAVAGIMALAVQAASPWLPPSRRVELAQGIPNSEGRF